MLVAISKLLSKMTATEWVMNYFNQINRWKKPSTFMTPVQSLLSYTFFVRYQVFMVYETGLLSFTISEIDHST